MEHKVFKEDSSGSSFPPITKRNTQTGTVLISLEMSDLYLYFCSLTKGGIWREVWEKHQENAAFEDDKNCLIFLIMAGNFCKYTVYTKNPFERIGT